MVDSAVKDHQTKKRKKSTSKPNDTAAQAGPSKPSPSTARLFQPFRALGYVTNHVPFAMWVHTPRGALAKPAINIVTSVGKSWMMWNADKITLLFVGKESVGEIRGLVMNGTSIFASAGDRVTKYERGQEVFRWVAPGQPQLGKIYLFGDQLLALKEDGTGLVIFDHVQRRVENVIDFHGSFTATNLVHPATYLNKVLVGSKEGELQLWNTRTCTLIHSYPHPNPSAASAVTALAQSPAVDVIGVGYADGTIRVYDIKQAEMVMQMKMDEGGVTQLSFRMDGPPILASGSTAGTFAVWDLSKGGRLIHVQRGAHEQAVSGLQFVQGQPLLVTSSGDNNIKQWLFETPTSVPSLLKFRGGHHAPPAHIRYYGDNGKQLLTAGRDRALRVTSVVRDSRSHELSQGQSIMKKALGMGLSADDLKLPPITALSSSATRSRQWEDVLTVHAEDNVARTWKAMDSRIGAWAFEMEQGAVQSACVTACGNFGLAGSSAGEIKMWNMQSGKERRSFALSGAAPGDSKAKIISASKFAKPQDADKVKAKAPIRSTKAITGLVTDALNTVVVASTLEGKLYFFDFHNTKLLHEMQLPSSVTQMDLNRDNGLLSVICDDLAIRIVDIETRRVVRDLRGFKGRILDTAFSHDSRWLIATALDGVIRTYDIPTGRLVDAFRTSSVCTSVAFSPSGDFLATAHVDSLGVHLWANRAQFMDVALKHIDEDREIVEIALPSIHGSQGNEGFGDLKKVGAPEFTDIYTTPDQLSEDLMTMSLLPRSRWQTLLNLETIKQRNKPKEPPKAPEAAPFFLPTVSGLETRFDLSAAQPEAEDSSKRLAPLQFLESDFTRRLAAEDASSDYTAFFEYAKALSPAALDLEIRSLVSLDHLSMFVHALTSRLESRKDFEAVQALMSVFLTVHSDVLIANEELINGLRNLRAQQKKETARLREMVGYALGTLGFLRSSA